MQIIREINCMRGVNNMACVGVCVYLCVWTKQVLEIRHIRIYQKEVGWNWSFAIHNSLRSLQIPMHVGKKEIHSCSAPKNAYFFLFHTKKCDFCLFSSLKRAFFVSQSELFSSISQPFCSLSALCLVTQLPKYAKLIKTLKY